MKKTKAEIMNGVWDIINDSYTLLGTYNGADFLIVSGWPVIEEVVYYVLEQLCPEAIKKYYAPYSLVKQYPKGKAIYYGDLAIGPLQQVPEEVRTAFKEVGFDDPSFEGIIGMPYGFFDEYQVCSYCDTIVRSYPDSYNWQPDYIDLDGEIICYNCFTIDEIDDYIKSKCNNPNTAVFSSLIDDKVMEHLGYKKVKDNLEAGIAECEGTDPFDLYQKLQVTNPGFYVFKIDSTGQFNTVFSLWKKEE